MLMDNSELFSKIREKAEFNPFPLLMEQTETKQMTLQHFDKAKLFFCTFSQIL